MIARYCNVLLQSLLLLVRVFETPALLKNRFGEGLMTEPRYALFVCRTDLLKNLAANMILSLERHFYGRMIQQSEGVHETVDTVLKEEWERDRTAAVSDRLTGFIQEKLHLGSQRASIQNKYRLRY